MLKDRELILIGKNSEDRIYQLMEKALTEPIFFDNFTNSLEDYKLSFNLENL
jgi:hypothetical protein